MVKLLVILFIIKLYAQINIFIFFVIFYYFRDYFKHYARRPNNAVLLQHFSIPETSYMF